MWVIVSGQRVARRADITIRSTAEGSLVLTHWVMFPVLSTAVDSDAQKSREAPSLLSAIGF